ncbi:hypothetical protein MKW98_013164 [Papaver atlanticum]|uniref:Uncharacterized protein n=1 Tax=Papaver atlanticum TaxID=357466 RepID=A0AAD4T8L9_9MAGN|nr:hypothetical protein MKW98_013164 [Papaver atlanticum]
MKRPYANPSYGRKKMMELKKIIHHPQILRVSGMLHRKLKLAMPKKTNEDAQPNTAYTDATYVHIRAVVLYWTSCLDFATLGLAGLYGVNICSLVLPIYPPLGYV